MTVDTAHADVNGRATPADDPYALASEQFEQALGDEAARLRALLEHETTQREHLQALLDQSKQRERRVQRALDVLTGETQPHGGPRLRTSKPPGRLGENMRRTGRANAERVMQALLDADEPLRVPDLARITGLAGSTAQRALNALRADDRVRATGQVGTAITYAPMPDARVEPVPSPSAKANGALSDDERAERERMIVEYGRDRDEFRAAELVGPLGLTSANRMGPMMRGFVNRGLLEQTRVEHDVGPNRSTVTYYRLTEQARRGS